MSEGPTKHYIELGVREPSKERTLEEILPSIQERYPTLAEALMSLDPSQIARLDQILNGVDSDFFTLSKLNEQEAVAVVDAVEKLKKDPEGDRNRIRELRNIL